LADDYYAILGVAKDATSQDIKRAFRQIARECHPDRSGGDPAAEERFKKSRQAYETLMDPVTRARYDRRGQRRLRKGESFFDAFYRHTGGGGAEAKEAGRAKPKRPGANPTGRKARKHDPGNDVSLDDLFNDFGFGGGRVDPGRREAQQSPPPSRSRPTPGDDVHVDIEVPAHVAQSGGSVTAVYYRMQRADSWRPGMGDPGLVRVQDIADVRIIPGTRTGEVLREKGLGNAGPHGGPYGDLVARIRIVAAQRSADTGSSPRPERPQHRSVDAGGGFSGGGRSSAGGDGGPFGGGPAAGGPFGGGSVGGGPRSAGHPTAEAPRRTTEAEAPEPRVVRDADGTRHEVTLDITVVEALLGGRVPFETAQGAVRLSIPPGSSGGNKLRLRGKGPRDPSGAPTDLYVRLRIVVPRDLDAESRRLIEAFARLNPDLAR